VLERALNGSSTSSHDRRSTPYLAARRALDHASAALLNASNPHVSSPYSAGDVIALFQKAFDSGDYESTKDTFEGLNQTGCPLD